MVWTETTCARYEWHSGRYASDLTDQEWALVAPHVAQAKATGRPRRTAIRDGVDAVLYIAHGLPMANAPIRIYAMFLRMAVTRAQNCKTF
jgi:transposase